VGNETVPAMYLLGERYVGAMENLAGSNNAKVVVLPADLQETVRGLMGRGKA
jgi:regulator of protease activity HflC (stomatin/prohibitin superfamily)